MRKYLVAIKEFILGDDGPTAVEYAVMLALIIVVCIGAIGTLGGNTAALFNNVDLREAMTLDS